MALQAGRRMMRQLIQPFQKSLRYRLMLLMVAIAVMPLTLVTLFAANTTKQSLSSEVKRSNESRMDWAAKYFEEKYDQIQAVTYSLLMDKNLFPGGSGGLDYGGTGLNTADSYILEKLRSLYIANNDSVAQVTLYIKSRNHLYIVDKDAVRTTDQISAPFNGWENTGHSWESINKITNSTRNNFTLVRSMNRFENREVLGGVSLEIRWKMMNSVLDMIHSEPNSQVLISDNQGNILYNPYPNSQQTILTDEILGKAAAEPAESGFMQLKQGYLFYRSVVSDQLRIVKFIPMSYVTAGAFSTLNFSFFTAIIFIMLAIFASILTAYFMTKPIIRLTKSMKAVELQNFDVGVTGIRSDEIGTLERRFNSMLQRIKELIQIEYKSKIEKRTAQLKAMQAQINPHFLYNALQSIGGIALNRNETEIYKHIRAISDLFRYTIKMKSDLVTIADELQHVGNYLLIQKLRFQDMIRIQTDVDEECRFCQIPKFSLQPIVENCFVHGLEGKMDLWTITVTIQMVLDEVEISIEDNGIGIGEERLDEIRRQLTGGPEDPKFGDSLGMNNVNSRIKLIFGEEYGLFVTSARGAGTTVKLVIPAVQLQGEE